MRTCILYYNGISTDLLVRAVVRARSFRRRTRARLSARFLFCRLALLCLFASCLSRLPGSLALSLNARRHYYARPPAAATPYLLAITLAADTLLFLYVTLIRYKTRVTIITITVVYIFEGK